MAQTLAEKNIEFDLNFRVLLPLSVADPDRAAALTRSKRVRTTVRPPEQKNELNASQ
jgi:hypothetical protein